MSDAAIGPATLGKRLLPWLTGPLATLEQARHSQRLGHAWLISGAPGTGKINLALVFTGRLLEDAAADMPPPLAHADALEAYRRRHEPADLHPDLHWVFPEDDKRSIGIEQIRETTRDLSLKGHSGAVKIVVIEPADAMTTSAANALLKTLEEPTPDTYLLLISHQPGRLPATIRSRCQRLNVASPDPAALAAWCGDDPRRSQGRSPRPLLDDMDNKTLQEINDILDNIESISNGKLDPQTLADRWMKCDLDSLLGALTGALQASIRAEFAAQGSKPVTDRPVHILHNVSAGVRLRLLFDQLRSAELLRDRLGRGTNAELALKVLLAGFKPV